MGATLPESRLGRCVYRFGVVDAPMVPQRSRAVLVVLQDGRQLEGELIMLTGRFQVAGTVFEPWEIEELLDD